jgi:hypothetical protein
MPRREHRTLRAATPQIVDVLADMAKATQSS